MLDSLILKKVEKYVRGLFSKNSVEENIYHSFVHTIEVVEIAEKIGILEKISNTDLEIVLIASWFHDTGYFHCCAGHEVQSSEYARNFLEKEFYPEENIEKIIGCIKATKIPQHPKNILEEIVCDADLQHLGQKDIEEKGALLRKEFELRGIKKLSDIDWLKTSIDFFSEHKYFTDYAKKEFGMQKHINQLEMKKKLKTLESELNNKIN